MCISFGCICLVAVLRSLKGNIAKEDITQICVSSYDCHMLFASCMNFKSDFVVMFADFT